MSDKAIGFFGSYEGMTDAQLATVERLLEEWAPTVVHHRSSIGADAQFDALAARMGIWREAHHSLAKRYHADLACDVVHPRDTPGEARRSVEGALHILLVALKGEEESWIVSGDQLTLEVLADGRLIRKASPARFLASQPTPLESADSVAEAFRKPERITDETLQLFTRVTNGEAQKWRALLENASPLYYARLREAATLRAEKIEAMVRRGIPLDEARTITSCDPIENRPEWAEAVWAARALAQRIEQDKFREIYRSLPASIKARYKRFEPDNSTIDATTQWILREQYGIAWFTRDAMNPFPPFWSYEFAEEIKRLAQKSEGGEPGEAEVHLSS